MSVPIDLGPNVIYTISREGQTVALRKGSEMAENKAVRNPVFDLAEGEVYHPVKYWTPERKEAMKESQVRYWKENGTEKLRGRKMSEEAKARLSERMKEYWAENESPWKGQHHSEETKALLRQKMLEKMEG